MFWLVTVILVLVLLEPITELLKVIAREALARGASALVDEVFRKATGDPLGDAVTTLLFGGLLAVFFFAQDYWDRAANLRRRASELVARVKALDDSGGLKEESKQHQEVVSLQAVERLAYSTNRTTFWLQVGIAVTVVWLATQFLYLALALAIDNVHRSRMEVLEPVLAPRQVSELRADWYGIDGRGDYERLQMRMEGLAQARDVRLPGMEE